MRKLVLPFLLTFLLTGCVGSINEPSTILPSGSMDVPEASAKPAAPSAEATDAPPAIVSMVIHPEQVLTAEEASDILGLPVAIEKESRNVDEEHGVSSLRYAYTLSEMTDVSALVQIEQDGLKPAEKLKEGLTARSSFDFQEKLLKDEASPVEDMGDAAFIMKNDGQLFMAYRGYYVVVAFTMDEYDSTKNAPFDIALGRKILENMQRLLNE